ncbi:MAG: hypothetical protein Q4C91_14660 [Eubacteriales bacterium]|nr:hypothetical protein [Eubacteriales bacterium]
MATKNCTTEKLAVIPDKSGAAKVTGMVMIGNITYCVKNNASGTSYLYKYDDCEVADYTTETISNCTSYGLAFSPSTKKVYIAAQGKKILSKGVDAATPSTITVNESEVKALTYYGDNKFILMANGLSSGKYLCFMTGTFSGGLFHKQNTFYVYNTGYSTVKDIYYNGTNGLFIVTNNTDNLKNKVLRVSMETPYGSGTYNGSSIYAVDDILNIDFSSAVYSQCVVESMALDKYGRIVLVCNAVNLSGSAGDAFFRVTNQTYDKKHYTEFRCTMETGITVPNAKPGSLTAKVTNLSGMAMNGNTAYFVKNSSAINKSALYIYTNYKDQDSGTSYELSGDGISYGMLFYNNYVFIAYSNQIRQFYTRNTGTNQIGSLRRTYPLSGYTIQALTLFEDGLFLALDTKSAADPTRLHFRILNCKVGTTASEVGDFYVDCDEDCRLQDIHYNKNHGLFIATNDLDYSTCKNRILRVDLTYLNKMRLNGEAIDGVEVPVASRWNVNFSTTIYSQCNIESLFISDSGELLTCCNVGKQEGQTSGLATDGVMKVTNFSFRTDGRGILVNVAKLLDIPNYGSAKVPGALAINGRKAYCYITNTSTNKETYLVYTDDYRTGAFEPVKIKLTNKGHCNGAAYYKNTLYSCDYIRSDKYDVGIFELDNPYSDINNKMEEVSTEKDALYGAITYYKDGKFLLVNYNAPSTYGINIRIDMGSFSKDGSGIHSYQCENSNYLTIDNTLIDETYDAGVLQDVHYEPGIGLFIGGYVSKPAPTSANPDKREPLHYMMRVDIDDYLNNDISQYMTPTEIYLLRYDNGDFETESPVISEYGELLVAGNKAADVLARTTQTIFTHEM